MNGGEKIKGKVCRKTLRHTGKAHKEGTEAHMHRDGPSGMENLRCAGESKYSHGLVK